MTGGGNMISSLFVLQGKLRDARNIHLSNYTLITFFYDLTDGGGGLKDLFGGGRR